MKVIRIPLRLLRNNEFNIYLGKANDTIVKFDPALLPIIDSLRLEMAAWMPKIDVAMANDAQSPLTEKIQNEDLIRDKYIRGLRNVALGYCDYFEEATSSAAAIVHRAIEKFGAIERASYVEETGLLEALIKDTVTDNDLKQAILFLKLDKWFLALETSNKKVFALHAQRTTENTPASEENVLKLRTHAITVYTRLMKKIDSAAELNDKGDYNKLIDQLNNIAAEANAILAMRKAGSDDKGATK